MHNFQSAFLFKLRKLKQKKDETNGNSIVSININSIHLNSLGSLFKNYRTPKKIQ